MPATIERPRPTSGATVSDQLRDAIRRDGRAAHAIAGAADVDPGILSRFLSGKRGITIDSLDRIAGALGLGLVATARGRGRPRS